MQYVALISGEQIQRRVAKEEIQAWFDVSAGKLSQPKQIINSPCSSAFLEATLLPPTLS